MKTLVTGGAGFIGSHLVQRLIKDGHKVIVLDNLSTGRLQNLDFANKSASVGEAFFGDVRGTGLRSKSLYSSSLSEALPPKLKLNQKVNLKQGFKAPQKARLPADSSKLFFKKVDISDGKIDKYFKGVDWVFHLAALADIVPSIVNPLDYHRANVDGTVNVLEASRKARVKRFIYAASASCYGIPKKYPTPETADIDPQYPYALTKYIGELYTLSWGKIYKLPVVSLRLFNVYGPRSRTSGTYGAVFGVFLAQKLARLPFTVVGDGRQTRDFTYVSDVVEAVMAAVKSKVENEIFNVGSGGSYSVKQLVKLLGGPVTYVPKRPGEPDMTLADIRKIKKVLRWKPKVAFSEGVKKLIENIDYWKNAPVWTPRKIKKATKEWFKYLD